MRTLSLLYLIFQYQGYNLSLLISHKILNVQWLNHFFVDSKYDSYEEKICSQRYVELKAESRSHAIFFIQLKRSGNDIQQFNIVVDFSLVEESEEEKSSDDSAHV